MPNFEYYMDGQDGIIPLTDVPPKNVIWMDKDNNLYDEATIKGARENLRRFLNKIERTDFDEIHVKDPTQNFSFILRKTQMTQAELQEKLQEIEDFADIPRGLAQLEFEQNIEDHELQLAWFGKGEFLTLPYSPDSNEGEKMSAFFFRHTALRDELYKELSKYPEMAKEDLPPGTPKLDEESYKEPQEDSTKEEPAENEKEQIEEERAQKKKKKELAEEEQEQQPKPKVGNMLDEDDSPETIAQKINKAIGEGDFEKMTLNVDGESVSLRKKEYNWPDDNMPNVTVKIDGKMTDRKGLEKFISEHRDEFINVYNEQYLKELEALGKSRKTYIRGDRAPVPMKDRGNNDQVMTTQQKLDGKNVKRGDYKKGLEIIKDTMSQFQSNNWHGVAADVDGVIIQVNPKVGEDSVRIPDQYDIFIDGEKVTGKDFSNVCKYVSLHEDAFRESMGDAIEYQKTGKKSKDEPKKTNKNRDDDGER